MPPRLRPPTRLLSAPRPGLPPRMRSGAHAPHGVSHRCAAGAPRWLTSVATHHEQLPSLSFITHEHIAGPGLAGFVPYDIAQSAQEALRSSHLAWKSLPVGNQADPPRPHLLSFEPTPTITLGRRQSALTADQSSRLQAPLRVALPERSNPIPEASFTPDIRETARGGLTTYHGPGQLVFWPVIDMHSALYPHFSVTSYAAHLEATTRRLLADVFGLESYITRDEPGVWVPTLEGQPERKIAAMGVHHRRYVTSLGIALNIDVPVTGAEETNPWARFVPCGLEGKLVTSVATELRERDGHIKGLEEWSMARLAAKWARLFEEGLQDESKRVFQGEKPLDR